MTPLAFLLMLAASVDEETARGAALYNDARFEEALAVFQGQLDDPAIALSLDAPRRAQLFVWVGLSRAQLSAFDAARAAFDAAVALDPAVALPTDAPPTIVALLEDARTRHATAPPTVPAPTAAPAPAPAPAANEEGAGVPRATVLFASAGVAGAAALVSAIAGGAFGAAALAARAAAESERYQDDTLAALGAAQARATVANVLWVTSGVLVVVAAGSAAAAVLGGEATE